MKTGLGPKKSSTERELVGKKTTCDYLPSLKIAEKAVNIQALVPASAKL